MRSLSISTSAGRFLSAGLLQGYACSVADHPAQVQELLNRTITRSGVRGFQVRKIVVAPSGILLLISVQLAVFGALAVN